MTEPASARSLPLWRQILDTLSDEIDGGHYPPGAKLPTEAEMARRFGVNRHTVRRALEGLRTDGRIHVRRGSGAYVTQGRFDYNISPRTRLSQNLADRGRTANRTWLRIEEVPSEKVEARALGLQEGEPVILTESIALADDVPINYARSAFPVERLPGFCAALREEQRVTTAFARIGFKDYQRLWTRLTAERPGVMIARHLKMPEAHPVLLSEALNICPKGDPIEFGRTWFCSDRVQLVVDSTTFDAGS